MAKIQLSFGDLEAAEFLERPNRFVVRCKLIASGDMVTAHLADPGRLIELLVPGARLYLRFVDKPQRKTKWSVILVKAQDSDVLVSVQSALVNQLTALALEKGGLPELGNWQLKRPEFSFAGSRWDFLLINPAGDEMLLEVKSCSLVHTGVAMFPDAVTERGRRHVESLAELQKQNKYTTAVLFVVQRSDAETFKPADHIDPNFGQALRKAAGQGVQIFARSTKVKLSGIEWGNALSIKL